MPVAPSLRLQKLRRLEETPMLGFIRNIDVKSRTLLLWVLAGLLSSAAPGTVQHIFAGDSPTAAKPKSSRAPKLREVVEVPEDYLGCEFTYTAQISTNSL